MSRVEVRLTGPGTTRVDHPDTGATLETASAPELGGPGGSFSSTDLVAAALGSCIASSLQPVAAREGLADSDLAIEVIKTLATGPRRIGRLDVRVTVARPLTDPQRRKLLATARSCAVHRSLGSSVDVEIALRDSGAGEGRGRR